MHIITRFFSLSWHFETIRLHFRSRQHKALKGNRAVEDLYTESQNVTAELMKETVSRLCCMLDLRLR